MSPMSKLRQEFDLPHLLDKSKKPPGSRARQFIVRTLAEQAEERPTASQALRDRWFTDGSLPSAFQALQSDSLKCWKPSNTRRNAIQKIPPVTKPLRSVVLGPNLPRLFPPDNQHGSPGLYEVPASCLSPIELPIPIAKDCNHSSSCDDDEVSHSSEQVSVRSEEIGSSALQVAPLGTDKLHNIVSRQRRPRAVVADSDDPSPDLTQEDTVNQESTFARPSFQDGSHSQPRIQRPTELVTPVSHNDPTRLHGTSSGLQATGSTEFISDAHGQPSLMQVAGFGSLAPTPRLHCDSQLSIARVEVNSSKRARTMSAGSYLVENEPERPHKTSRRHHRSA